MRRPRRRVLEATPLIFMGEKGAFHCTRKVYRTARRVAIKPHTVSAFFAVVNFALLCWLRIVQAPEWLILWTAVVGFGNLVFALHGWRYADQKTAAVIMYALQNKDSKGDV